jgi:predicted metalloprotease with PDZ domain
VRVELPGGWRSAVSALPRASGAPHHFLARDFDTLVDSPLVAGTPSVHAFTAAGRPHLLVNVGDDALWDAERSIADLAKLVEEHAAFWGGGAPPYERYVIFNIISEASGGLEHRDSTVLMTSKWKMRTRRAYVDWLSLVSHELFHVWNGKRLRPIELGPFEYEQENYTRALWVVEGLTSYYGDLLAARAGVITEEEYLGELGSMIADLQTTPGRLSHPVSEASFDAWIRYYRQDENTPNATVSYYTKGAIVGLLLDLEIRRASGDARSLDDVLRAAYGRYSEETGFTGEQFRALISDIAGRDLSPWLRHALDTTEELDYAPLAHVGLRLHDDRSGTGGRAWLGLQLARPATLKNDDGRLVVTQVRRGTPAYEAGVNVDDEIVALGGYRVRPDGWEARLGAFRPGEALALLVARRERLVTLEVTAGAEPPRSRLDADPAASAAAKVRRGAWLGAAAS